MISSLTIKNFKSYAEATLQLSKMTFLIGPNASGKSNALEALRLLNWLAKGSRLDDIERNILGADTLIRGQASDLFLNGEESLSLDCFIPTTEDGWSFFHIALGLISGRLTLTAESVSSPVENLPLYTVDGAPKIHTNTVSVLYNNFKKGKHKPHITCSNQQAIFYQLETPGRFGKEHEKSQKLIPAVTKSIRETLQNIVFLDPRPASMRSYAFASKDDEIKEDGSNVSSVLYRICNQGETHKKELLSFICSLPEQDITDISFIKTERNDVMVRLHESFGDKERVVDAPLLSDGTLRVLSIAATLFSTRENGLVIIEEIDNGVHPSRAETLVSQILHIASTRNLHVLITSHNPALLDAVPDEALGDVLCCYRDPTTGYSQITRLDRLERYPELIAQGTLGQLATKRILERFLKDNTTSQERKAAALSWLDDLKQEGAAQ